MSEQVQCPNCGGYKLHTEKQITIATEKQQIKYNWFVKLSNLVTVGGLILFLVYVAIPPSTQTQTAGNNYIGYSLVFGAIALGLAVYLFNLLTDRITKTVPSVIKYNLYCELCGYRWTWQNDQPYPTVNVNPALIQQGEQRLQEEAARRQRDMEAAWLLQQQQQKK